MTTLLRRGAQSDFVGEVHVYEPHVVGLPPLRPYLSELWRRRHFAVELSRTSMRAQHFETVFGQLWLVINPLLLGVVYFLLIDILRGSHRHGSTLTHLLGNLFVFYLVSNSMTEGANSVTGGGKLILNTAFPRLLLPLSSVITAVMRFLPTLIVYAIAHVVGHYPIGWHLLYTIPILVLIVIFATGMATFFAALQVYFRDTKSFLPYITRIWLYLSPVLYRVEDVPKKIKPLIAANPLYYLLGSWGEILSGHRTPSWSFLGAGAAWAFAALLLGAGFFMSRERDFAVRL